MSKDETTVEPSMDEILSSIRKIIADDEPETRAADAVATADALDADDSDDDILELTQADEASTGESVEPVLVEDETPALETAADDDMDAEDGADEMVVLEAEMEPDQADAEADPSPIQALEAVPEADVEPQPEPEAQPAVEVLLDDVAAEAAGGALQRLSAALAPGDAMPGGSRSIEAFLSDLVRPELKTWLDEHLPSLVERIVEREIKKLVRDAQPD